MYNESLVEFYTVLSKDGTLWILPFPLEGFKIVYSLDKTLWFLPILYYENFGPGIGIAL